MANDFEAEQTGREVGALEPRVVAEQVSEALGDATESIHSAQQKYGPGANLSATSFMSMVDPADHVELPDGVLLEGQGERPLSLGAVARSEGPGGRLAVFRQSTLQSGIVEVTITVPDSDIPGKNSVLELRFSPSDPTQAILVTRNGEAQYDPKGGPGAGVDVGPESSEVARIKDALIDWGAARHPEAGRDVLASDSAAGVPQWVRDQSVADADAVRRSSVVDQAPVWHQP